MHNITLFQWTETKLNYFVNFLLFKKMPVSYFIQISQRVEGIPLLFSSQALLPLCSQKWLQAASLQAVSTHMPTQMYSTATF